MDWELAGEAELAAAARARHEQNVRSGRAQSTHGTYSTKCQHTLGPSDAYETKQD